MARWPIGSYSPISLIHLHTLSKPIEMPYQNYPITLQFIVVLSFSYQRHKSMFVFFIILTVISFSTIQFISPIPKTTQLEFHCNDRFKALKFCPSKLDHCATDAFLRNGSNEYIFDVSKNIEILSCSIEMHFFPKFFSYNVQ